MPQPNHHPWCQEIGRGGASIQTESTGMDFGRFAGNTFLSSHCKPPSIHKNGAAMTNTAMMPKRNFAGRKEDFICDIVSTAIPVTAQATVLFNCPQAA